MMNKVLLLLSLLPAAVLAGKLPEAKAFNIPPSDQTADMLRAIGGLGLFLVGMQMLSGGLQSPSVSQNWGVHRPDWALHSSYSGHLGSGRSVQPNTHMLASQIVDGGQPAAWCKSFWDL